MDPAPFPSILQDNQAHNETSLRIMDNKTGYIARSYSRWLPQNQKKKGTCSFSLALLTTKFALVFHFLSPSSHLCFSSLYPSLANHLWKLTPRRKRDTELSQPQLFFWKLLIMGNICENNAQEEGWEPGWRGQEKFPSWKDPQPICWFLILYSQPSLSGSHI